MSPLLSCAGLPPIVYFTFNKTLRGRILQVVNYTTSTKVVPLVLIMRAATESQHSSVETRRLNLI
jgi:hypothetical protein